MTEVTFTKKCPMCPDGQLVERENSQNGSHFLGCSNFPERCQHTEPLPAYVELLRAGATLLPGMEDM